MLIKLTEITKEGDGTKTQPILVQADFIGTVTTGKLAKSTAGGIHIVGESKIETMTFITLKNNLGIFVEESLEDIEKLVA